MFMANVGGFTTSFHDNKLDIIKIADGFEYDYIVIDHSGDELIVQTNHEAPKGKVIKIDFNNPKIEKWVDLIPEKEEVLEGVGIVGGKLYTQYLKDASNRAYFYTMDGEFVNELELPTVGSISEFNGNKEDNIAFYGFTSFAFPSSIYTYDIENNSSKIYKASELNFDSEAYETKQVFFESKDGTKVPMFIVSKK